MPICVIAGVVKVGEFMSPVESGTFSLARRQPAEALDRRSAFAKSEIQHLHRAVVPNLDVGRLEIAMDDAGSCAASSASAICRAIGSASSSGIGPRAIRCERSSPSTSSIAKCTVGLLDDAVDLRDVWMIERGERLRLALEARQAVGIGREQLRQDLDCDITLQLRDRGRDTPRPFRRRRSHP